MAVDGRYEQARAQKTNSRAEVGVNFNSKKTKKYAKKVTKSPLLLVVIITAIIGILGGFFITKALCKFEMNDYYVGGVVSVEKDYVIVDVTEHKARLEESAGVAGLDLTMDQIYTTLGLDDKGVKITFFGMDLSETITTKYYYREDISFEATECAGIDVKIPGVYYVEYSSSHFAYKNVTLIRTIIVMGVEVDG